MMLASILASTFFLHVVIPKEDNLLTNVACYTCMIPARKRQQSNSANQGENRNKTRIETLHQTREHCTLLHRACVVDWLTGLMPDKAHTTLMPRALPMRAVRNGKPELSAWPSEQDVQVPERLVAPS